MRIALAVEGTRGDVHPMLSLAGAFRSAGHDVVLCGPKNFATDAAEHSIEFCEVGSDTRAFMEQVAPAVSSRGLAASRAQLEYFKDSVEKQFTKLPDATRGADLILGAGVQLAAASVAELQGIPYRYVVYCPAMLPSPDHAPVFIPTQSLSRSMNRIAWWLTLGPVDRLMRFGLNRARARYLGLGKIKSAFMHALSPRPILATDPAIAPVPNGCRIPVDQLGCFHDHDTAPLPTKLEDFLTQGPPPVYVGFGSMTHADPEASTQLVLDAIERVGCRAVVSEGWAGLGSGPLPEGVLQTGPVSHASLFPRCAAVVHHGGAGTTTRAAQAGVPQVIIPHLLDQYWWGKQITNLGLAPPPLPKATLSADQLATTLENVLGNEMLSERAAEIGQKVARDATPARAVDAILESLND